MFRGAVVDVAVACVDQLQQHAIEEPAEIFGVPDRLQLTSWRNSSPMSGVVAASPSGPLGFAELKLHPVEDALCNRLVGHAVHPAGGMLEQRLSFFGDSQLFDQALDLV